MEKGQHKLAHVLTYKDFYDLSSLYWNVGLTKKKQERKGNFTAACSVNNIHQYNPVKCWDFGTSISFFKEVILKNIISNPIYSTEIWSSRAFKIFNRELLRRFELWLKTTENVRKLVYYCWKLTENQHHKIKFYIIYADTLGFYAQKQLLPSARLSHRNSVCLSVSHTGGSFKNGGRQDHQIFTVGCLEDSSFRNRKAFP